MLKKIKQYFKLKRQIQHEVLETLCTICLYLGHIPGSHNPYRNYMFSHASALKSLSAESREKPKKEPEFLKKEFHIPEEKTQRFY